MLQKITLHDKIIILAIHLANKALKQAKLFAPAHTSMVTVTYRKICELVGEDPNVDSYVSTRIKSLDDMQIIQAEKFRGLGNTKYIDVSVDVEVIIDNLFPPEFNDIIEKNYFDIELVILDKVKKELNDIESLKQKLFSNARSVSLRFSDHQK